MYFNWFTTDFKTNSSYMEDNTFAGTYECEIVDISEKQCAIKFYCLALDRHFAFITDRDNIFNTKKEALELAKIIMKGRIATLEKTVLILEQEIENNIS